jgi:thiamine pyrophosphate-dependent acetolactate synthase large subunit-like protein
MKYRDCIEYIASRRVDELVVTSAGSSSEIWYAITDDVERTFYLEASMSLTSMFAAGLAQGVPGQTVWTFSGDGAFCMNPGMLMVERQMDLPNLKHFMLSNRVYGSTSNTVLPGRANNDYAAVARGFGIEHVSAFDSLDGLTAGFDAAVMQPGHAFVVLEIEPYAYGKASPPMDGPEVKFNFGRHIERATGKQIFARPTGH